MPEYRVMMNVGTTVFVTVEADDETEALEMAGDEVPSICAQCSGWGKSWSRDEWEPDHDSAEVIEVDGEPVTRENTDG